MDSSQLPRVKVEDLKHGMFILDPEGNDAQVIRVKRVDNTRGRLETDMGIAVVALTDTFPVIAGADPS